MEEEAKLPVKELMSELSATLTANTKSSVQSDDSVEAFLKTIARARITYRRKSSIFRIAIGKQERFSV